MDVFLLKQFIKIFIFIHLITQTFGIITCTLNYDTPWFDDYHILVKQHNNQYELFGEGTLPAKEKLLFLCNNRSPIVVTCGKSGKFDRPLPLKQKCELKDAIQPMLREMKAAPYCPYKLIQVGFETKIDSRSHFLEAYRVCFDNKHMRTLFTINKVYTEHDVRRPTGVGFSQEDGYFSNSLFGAFKKENINARFQKLLSTSKYTENKIIDRGLMTPYRDFRMSNIKRSTFFRINTMPQFISVNNNNWHLVEGWITKPMQGTSNICTGVFECKLDSENINDLDCVLQLKDVNGKLVPIFLADDRKMPIPLWIYKIWKKGDLVFLTLNNIYHEGAVKVPEKICQEVKCPMKLKAKIESGRTFCCNYDHFIRNNVPHLKDVC